MKILCLHGYGTCGEILEEQMSSLIASLGSHHEFVFLDGEYTVTRPDFADISIQGEQSRAWYEGGIAKAVRPAHELLAATLAEEYPPFDGILGHSQGAALAMAYLLNFMIEHPGQPLPVRFGVFFNTSFCVAPYQDYKQEEISSFTHDMSDDDYEAMLSKMTTGKAHKTPSQFDAVKKLTGRPRELFGIIMDEIEAAGQTRNMFHAEGTEDMASGASRHNHEYVHSDFPRFYNAAYTAEKLPIPTVHVQGLLDGPGPRKLATIGQELCEPECRITLEIHGGHEIPYRQPGVGEVARAIERAHYMGQLLYMASERTVAQKL